MIAEPSRGRIEAAIPSSVPLSEYTRIRLTIPAGEMVYRKRLARDVIQAYLSKAESMPPTVRAQDPQRFGQSAGASEFSTPTLSSVSTWMIDVENALRAIGMNDCRILVARMRKQPVRKADIMSTMKLSGYELEARLAVAIIHFTDELIRRGISDDAREYAAA